MGRPLRLKAPDLTYHITSRTNGGRLFFQTKHDKKALCQLLNKILLKYDVIAHGFTAMNNHFHVIIHIKNDADLSKVMGEFKTLYAKYHNKRYGTYGHFWGDRFRSTIIQDDKYALTCLRYVDRNPVKAGLVDHPGKWPLSSFNSYAYGKTHPILRLRPHPTYLALSKSRVKRREMYLTFVLDKEPASDELTGKLWKLPILGSEEFVKEVKQRI